MTRTLFLHLGMNKTGSTTIQRSLSGVSNARVRYATLGRPNHTPAMVQLFADDALREEYFAGGKPKRPQITRADLDHELGRDRRDVVISGEGFPKVLNPANIADLLSAVSPHVDRVQALAYVRPPRSFMRSLVQQRIKNGLVELTGEALWPNYQERFEKWENAMGADHLTLVPFEPKQLRGQDVLTDFAHRVGYGAADLTARKDMNASMSAEAFATLFEWRHLQERRNEPREHGLKRAFPRGILAFGETPFELGESVVGQILRDNAADLAWVETRMGHRFEPEQPRQDGVVFDTVEEILDYARRVRPEFERWTARLERPSPTRAEMERILHGLAQT